MHTKEDIINNFNPNGVGVNNGNFIGLPFNEEQADVIIFPVPWDVTVSYGAGTSNAYKNILNASYQLDLYLEEAPDTWKKGIYFHKASKNIIKKNKKLRRLAEQHIEALESGLEINEKNLKKVNKACQELNEFVYIKTKKILSQGKKVVLLGGDHSTPLGYIKALAEEHEDFGILQIDAHCDLRAAYEGFTYSHASIFYNVLNEIPQVKHISQVGIRDYCEEEANMASNDARIQLYTDNSIRTSLFEGVNFHFIIKKILNELPQKVYISFDIDGLNPDLCQGTGTPVPGGFSFQEIVYLLEALRNSGKEIIGCDLCEVSAHSEFDGNVGARILYRLISLL